MTLTLLRVDSLELFSDWSNPIFRKRDLKREKFENSWDKQGKGGRSSHVWNDPFCVFFFFWNWQLCILMYMFFFNSILYSTWNTLFKRIQYFSLHVNVGHIDWTTLNLCVLYFFSVSCVNSVKLTTKIYSRTGNEVITEIFDISISEITTCLYYTYKTPKTIQITPRGSWTFLLPESRCQIYDYRRVAILGHFLSNTISRYM